MSESIRKEKEPGTEVRVVVEVDGSPVGFLSLDIDRLWPLINHSKRDASSEWIDAKRYDAVMRAAVIKRLVSRLSGRLYQVLGDEMVKAELDVESFALKADAALQAFGRTHGDIEKLVEGSHRTPADFLNFFWDYMLDEKEVGDLKKEWKNSKGGVRSEI